MIFKLPFKIHPVVAEESGLRRFSNRKAFKKVEELARPLTRSAFHGVFSNAVLNSGDENNWRDQFINYLKFHAR